MLPPEYQLWSLTQILKVWPLTQKHFRIALLWCCILCVYSALQSDPKFWAGKRILKNGYFPVVLFIMLNNADKTFELVAKILN